MIGYIWLGVLGFLFLRWLKTIDYIELYPYNSERLPEQDARVYWIKNPITYRNSDNNYEPEYSHFVWISAVPNALDVFSGTIKETYAFACNFMGHVRSWIEHSSSIVGEMNHKKVLERIVNDPTSDY